MINVRWTGAAGLEFTVSERTILIDPYLSRPSKWQLLCGRPRSKENVIEKYLGELPGNLSALIAGHTHIDHALDIPEFSLRFAGPVVGSRSLDSLLNIHGMPERVKVCVGGEKIKLFQDATATMIRSRHGLVFCGRAPFPGEISREAKAPLKNRAYRHGTVFIVKLEIEGVVFMHLGTANFIESELTGHRCDVLFMTVPGWKKMPNPERFFDIVKPKVIVPFHFDNFSAPLQPHLKTPTLPLLDMQGFFKFITRCTPQAKIRNLPPFTATTF